MSTQQEKGDLGPKRDIDGMGVPEIKYGDSVCFIMHVATGLWLSYMAPDAKSSRLGPLKRRVSRKTVLSECYTRYVSSCAVQRACIAPTKGSSPGELSSVKLRFTYVCSFQQTDSEELEGFVRIYIRQAIMTNLWYQYDLYYYYHYSVLHSFSLGESLNRTS